MISGPKGITGRIYRDKLPFVGYEDDWAGVHKGHEAVVQNMVTHQRRAPAVDAGIAAPSSDLPVDAPQSQPHTIAAATAAS